MWAWRVRVRVRYLDDAPPHAVRVVVEEEGGKPEGFAQPVHHIHLQLCARRTGGLYKGNTHIVKVSISYC